MGGETRWPLRQAAALARSLVTFLEPYCDRIEVAGSVRRQKADVGDIELVLVPKLEQRPVPGREREAEKSAPRREMRGPGDAERGRMNPEERRQLRRDIQDAGKDIYRPAPQKRGDPRRSERR